MPFSKLFQRHRESSASSSNSVHAARQENSNIAILDTGCKRTLTTFAFGQQLQHEQINCVVVETAEGSLDDVCRQEQVERLMEISTCSDDDDLDEVYVPSFSSSMSSGEVSRRLRAINLDLDGKTTEENYGKMENRMPCTTPSLEVDAATRSEDLGQNIETNPSWIRRLLQRLKISCFN